MNRIFIIPILLTPGLLTYTIARYLQATGTELMQGAYSPDAAAYGVAQCVTGAWGMALGLAVIGAVVWDRMNEGRGE